MSDPRRTRARLNWLNLTTPLGLAVARLGGARLRRDHERHLWIAEGYGPRFPVAGAFTVGSVVITATTIAQREAALPGTLDHEEAHARQYAYCLGLPFFPAYLATMAWSWLRTGDKASACFFEEEAGLDGGGYPVLDRRPLRAGFADLRGVVRRPGGPRA